EILGVSRATVRNWEKLNYLSSSKNKNGYIYYYYTDIIELKNKIKDSKIDKLNKRANKNNAKNSFIPIEYLENSADAVIIKKIIEYISTRKLSYNFSLFVLTLNYLFRKNIIISSVLKKLILFDSYNKYYKKIYIYDELKNWFFEESFFKIKFALYDELMNFNLPDSGDILGLLYQSFKIESDKSRKGSYYTPSEIVENIVCEYCEKNFKVLDPCCGTGQFLMKFAEIVTNPENIFGFDVDKTAVKLARINIMIKYSDIEFSPNIFCLNTALDINHNSTFFNNENICFENFDLIATNPPWGSDLSKSEKNILNKYFPEIQSGESFSYILLKSIELAKNNGIISFVLPESILNVKTHSYIRKFLLENTDILKIIFFNRVFKKVFSRVIRVDLKKTVFKTGNIFIINGKNCHSITQSRLKNNNDYIFDIHLTEIDEKILKKIFSIEHITLKDNADWALGIVTGNNKQLVSSKKLPGFERVYKGREIEPFHLKECKNFIKFVPENFQQSAPEYKYRAPEKLIYKFISDKLVFAYDDRQCLTLNSANIVIPKIDGYPIKAIMSFFNHPIYQFIFRKKFTSIKVLRNHLETLPLPLFNQNVLKKIESYADDIIYKNIEPKILFDFIFKIFKITEDEKKYIVGNNNF
ncbi:N-6 DNA methylase, partial [Candidatus Dependentiae bacterium]|nr:N-6 DNA methylase [Candidatus Dependentiae bacterium]